MFEGTRNVRRYTLGSRRRGLRRRNRSNDHHFAAVANELVVDRDDTNFVGRKSWIGSNFAITEARSVRIFTSGNSRIRARSAAVRAEFGGGNRNPTARRKGTENVTPALNRTAHRRSAVGVLGGDVSSAPILTIIVDKSAISLFPVRSQRVEIGEIIPDVILSDTGKPRHREIQIAAAFPLDLVGAERVNPVRGRDLIAPRSGFGTKRTHAGSCIQDAAAST